LKFFSSECFFLPSHQFIAFFYFIKRRYFLKSTFVNPQNLNAEPMDFRHGVDNPFSGQWNDSQMDYPTRCP